jgi:hypothetical protein
VSAKPLIEKKLPSGTDNYALFGSGIIFKSFSPKKSAKNLAVWLKVLLFRLREMIITLFLFQKKNANFRRAIFFAESWQKSQKIFIITLASGEKGNFEPLRDFAESGNGELGEPHHTMPEQQAPVL